MCRETGSNRPRAGFGVPLLLTVAAALVACASPESKRPDPAEQESAAAVARALAGPDFELLGLDGAHYRLSSYRGQVVLVNFWATWCLACRQELPILNRLHRAFGEKGVAVIGIATDRGARSIVEPYVEQLDLDYPILLDPGEISASIFGGLAGYPSTFILDAQGLIYASYLGAQAEATFAEDLRYLLQAAPSEAAAMPPGALSEDPHPSGTEAVEP